ncbi:hypothetical protein [Pseudooceanicola sp.]|jgi:hypothetical protein|uniref:hypothetical protein n=1 Tax=Pseudooceanicola sp. TaxID=1914328 RepID=UPI0040589167
MTMTLTPVTLAISALFMLIMIGSLVSAFGHSSTADRFRGIAVFLICLGAIYLALHASSL